MNEEHWRVARRQVGDALDRLEAWTKANPRKAPTDPVLCRALELVWLLEDAAAGDDALGEPIGSDHLETYRETIELEWQLRQRWDRAPHVPVRQGLRGL